MYCRNIQAPHITQDHVFYCWPLKMIEFQYRQGGSKVIRSLDSLMGQALSYGSSEGPRLVSSSRQFFSVWFYQLEYESWTYSQLNGVNLMQHDLYLFDIESIESGFVRHIVPQGLYDSNMLLMSSIRHGWSTLHFWYVLYQPGCSLESHDRFIEKTSFPFPFKQTPNKIIY